MLKSTSPYRVLLICNSEQEKEHFNMCKISVCLCVTCNTCSFIVIVISLFITFSLICLRSKHRKRIMNPWLQQSAMQMGHTTVAWTSWCTMATTGKRTLWLPEVMWSGQSDWFTHKNSVFRTSFFSFPNCNGLAVLTTRLNPTTSIMYQVWLPLRLKAKCLSSHWRQQDAMQLLKKIKCTWFIDEWSQDQLRAPHQPGLSKFHWPYAATNARWEFCLP